MKEESVIKLPSIEELEAWLSKRFLRKDRSEIILYLSIIFYTLIFSSITILRHYAFKTRAWDLGIFTQSLGTTLNGDGFFITRLNSLSILVAVSLECILAPYYS